jgi:hypothetical protein
VTLQKCAMPLKKGTVTPVEMTLTATNCTLTDINSSMPANNSALTVRHGLRLPRQM